jgi:hypothetical protein
MTENSSEPGKESERRGDRDTPSEKKTDTDNNDKRQSGRPPARPPYEQYRRMNNR